MLADDPMLNCRLGDDGRNPIRIICDSKLQIPLDSKLVQTAKDIPLLVATCSKDEEKQAALTAKGAEVLVFDGEKVPLPALMNKLGEKQISGILLEGGATLNAAFLAENLIQRAYVYMGAKVFGGAAAKSPIAGGGVLLPSDAADLHLAEVQTFGNDVLCVYDFPKQEAK